MPNNLKSFIKRVVLGNDIPQEYLCLEGNLKDSTEVLLKLKDIKIKVTQNHLFLGYKPLIIALVFNYDEKHLNELKSLKTVTLDFEVSNKKTGNLDLKLYKEINLGRTYCFIYTGLHGKNIFLFPLHRFANLILGKLKPQKEGNINLPGNLYEQVKIAYSLPRAISLISIHENNLYNVFPTDLNGRVDKENYIISLRLDKKANDQVNNIKKLIICRMSLKDYKEIYLMGKNHSKELQSPENLRFGNKISAEFSIKVPKGAISYLELKLIESIPIGIHNVIFLKIINEVLLRENAAALTHIHRDYAIWRNRHGFETNYLLR